MSQKKPKEDSEFLCVTRQENKLLEAASDIYGTPPTGTDMAFTHAVFCQVGLPRSKVDGREFMRRSGAAWVNVQAVLRDNYLGRRVASQGNVTMG